MQHTPKLPPPGEVPQLRFRVLPWALGPALCQELGPRCAIAVARSPVKDGPLHSQDPAWSKNMKL